MTEQEIEKVAICHICLETLTMNLYFASDGRMYQKNCFDKLDFKSLLSRQGVSYYLPVNKVVIGKV